MNLIAPISEATTVGLACPKCGERRNRVTDSRPNDEGTHTRRRRHCLSGGHRYGTTEQVTPEYSGEIDMRAVAEKVARAEKSVMWLGSLLNELKRELEKA
jgi:hypothetical protein